MQSVHSPNQLIEQSPLAFTLPPAVFRWASQGRVSLLWEAKALDGLELPVRLASGYREHLLLEMLKGS